MTHLKPWLALALLVGLASAAVMLSGDTNAAEKKKEDAKQAEAVAAATRWLEETDGGKHAAAWEASATYFKKAVPKKDWIRSVRAVRDPLGKVLERKLASATYATSLPGAPDGEYYVLQFKTSFQNKKASIETVTPMLDADGRWHVSGYYVK